MFGCAQDKAEEEIVEEISEEAASDIIPIMCTEEIEKWEEYTKEVPTCTGVNGETPIWFSEVLDMTEEEIEEVRSMELRVAYVAQNMHTAEEARVAGATKAIQDLNMTLISLTECGMDTARQQSNVESVMALNPDIITSLAIDPVQAAEAFRPAVDAGVTLTFLSGIPAGYELGKDYAGMVTWDCYGSGAAVAELLAESIRETGEEGKIGYIFHGLTFWNTNEWDKGFKETIEGMSDMEIITEHGLQDASEAEEIASAMITQYPEINGIYASWGSCAEYALSGIRGANRPDIKLACNEVSEPLALDMANDGNFIGGTLGTDYLLGYTRIFIAANDRVGNKQETFSVIPVIPCTKENIEENWFECYRYKLPEEILEKLHE